MSSILEYLVSALGGLAQPLKGFGVQVVLSSLVFLHYRRYGSALSGKQSFGPVLPFIGLTTFLVIAVVKSSFALSLGLVGALSIVRFRTPIKDPEELAYLFLTIAAGIGTAAGQLRLTTSVVLLILVIITLTRRGVRDPVGHAFVSLDVGGVTDSEAAFGTVDAALRAHAQRLQIIRVEQHGDALHVTAEAELASPQAIPRIASQIRLQYPATNVSGYDESRLPSP